MAKDIKQGSKSGELTKGKLDQFLAEVNNLPPAVRSGAKPARLAFVIDATASRQPTWDMASQLQGEMLQSARKNGEMYLQVLWFRGFGELKKTPWSADGTQLARLMSGVTCKAGQTQIERCLRELLRQSGEQQINAVVYVGDCCEEPANKLLQLAGKLGLINTPLFIFQDGQNPRAAQVFEQMSKRSGGAFCQLDHTSAELLQELLNAVASFATGGKQAVKSLPPARHKATRHLLEQLDK